MSRATTGGRGSACSAQLLRRRRLISLTSLINHMISMTHPLLGVRSASARTCRREQRTTGRRPRSSALELRSGLRPGVDLVSALELSRGLRTAASRPAAYHSSVRASGTFRVVAFTPADPPADPAAGGGLPTGVATMEKRYEGEVEGRSATRFAPSGPDDRPSFARDGGGYTAVESFEGSIGGASGSFNFAYSATAHGCDRFGAFFSIVPASGTGQLTGIHGSGGMAIDADGSHRIWFEYELR